MKHPRRAKKGPTIDAEDRLLAGRRQGESKSEETREGWEGRAGKRKGYRRGGLVKPAPAKGVGYRRGGFVPPSPLKSAVAKLKRPARLPRPAVGMVPPAAGDVGMISRFRRQPPFIAPPPVGP